MKGRAGSPSGASQAGATARAGVGHGGVAAATAAAWPPRRAPPPVYPPPNSPSVLSAPGAHRLAPRAPDPSHFGGSEDRPSLSQAAPLTLNPFIEVPQNRVRSDVWVPPGCGAEQAVEAQTPGTGPLKSLLRAGALAPGGMQGCGGSDGGWDRALFPNHFQVLAGRPASPALSMWSSVNTAVRTLCLRNPGLGTQIQASSRQWVS